MNPLSSFSFGKIVALLCDRLVLYARGAWGRNKCRGIRGGDRPARSHAGILSQHRPLVVRKRVVRQWADSNMDTQLKGTRVALEARAIEGLTVVLRGHDPGAPRVHLHDFFLPVMDLDRLTFLRESYLSWFEFQINSAVALLLTGIAYAATMILLGHRWSLPIDWRIHTGKALSGSW